MSHQTFKQLGPFSWSKGNKQGEVSIPGLDVGWVPRSGDSKESLKEMITELRLVILKEASMGGF